MATDWISCDEQIVYHCGQISEAAYTGKIISFALISVEKGDSMIGVVDKAPHNIVNIYW